MERNADAISIVRFGFSNGPRFDDSGPEEGSLRETALKKWVWLKIKHGGLRRFWYPYFHLPGFHSGTGFLSQSQVGG